MTDTERGMFKQYDIRVKSSKLSDESKVKLCRATVAYYKNVLKVDSVVIGRDARLFAPALVEELICWFKKAGIDVIINPLPISTCQFYYTCMQHRSSGGIMVTASHNPGEYIGLKLMAPELYALAFNHGPEGGIKKILELFDTSIDFNCKNTSCVKIVNYTEPYIDYCMKLAGVTPGSLKGLRILFDFLNGSAGAEVALAFQKAGASIECLDIVPDGRFPKGDPNPGVESSIAPAREIMKNGNFDLGFCFDGDGDRLDLMGPDGGQIVPGLNMSIIMNKTKAIFKGQMNDFYADVRSLPLSLLEMSKSGVNIHLIRNGHSFIKGKLRENATKGYFGSVEESAHYYLNFPYDIDDLSKGYAAVEATLFFALLSARCYKENPNEYKRVVDIQNSMFRVREWHLYCETAPEKIPVLMSEIEEKFVSMGASVIKTMDDGSDIDASLMRFNLPTTFDSTSSLDNVVWAQIAQRVSRSEDALCRWEVVSNSQEECVRLNAEIRKITDKYVAKGWARY